MGQIIIHEETTKNPITLIGKMAGTCWGADTTDDEKNYKRGLSCLQNQHGRTWEFPEVYLTADGYSARMIRELYTHIGGAPTRLQASTRYIDYGRFNYVIPHSIKKNQIALKIYKTLMGIISWSFSKLQSIGIPKEDIAMILPLGMGTKIVGKYNARTLVDMSHQRLCSRAYWEYREFMKDLINALIAYSKEWAEFVVLMFKAKCDYLGYCPEAKPCKLQYKNK
jgi:thymidylate synthase (FAD)